MRTIFILRDDKIKRFARSIGTLGEDISDTLSRKIFENFQKI